LWQKTPQNQNMKAHFLGNIKKTIPTLSQPSYFLRPRPFTLDKMGFFLSSLEKNTIHYSVRQILCFTKCELLFVVLPTMGVEKLSTYVLLKIAAIIIDIITRLQHSFDRRYSYHLARFHPGSPGRGWAGTSTKPLVIGRHPRHGSGNLLIQSLSSLSYSCHKAVRETP